MRVCSNGGAEEKDPGSSIDNVEDDRGARLTVRDGRQHVLIGHNIVCKAARRLFLARDAC